MGSRFDAGDRHSDDQIAAIHEAARSITRTLAKGFELVAHQISAAQVSPDNAAAIEANVKKIRDLTDQLQNSLHPATR
jgi:hypothetical protein